MLRKILICAAAAAVMVPAVAIGHPGGGGGGGGGAAGAGGFGSSGGMGGMGGFGHGGPMGMGMGNGSIGGMGSSMRNEGRITSQGPAHASETGIAHANQNSVLAGTTAATTVKGGSLAGLTTGMTLFSNGTPVGRVQQIRMTGNGSVALVIVKGTNGGLYPVPASKLTFSGGTLSTTSRLAGINSSAPTRVAMSSQARLNSQGPMHASATGIAHANSRSVLASAQLPTGMSSHRRQASQGPLHASATAIAHANSRSVLGGASRTPITSISVGMPLFSNGTQVGTVYRVVSAKGVIRRVLVQATNGRTYSLAPGSLNLSGGSVTTTAMLRGL